MADVYVFGSINRDLVAVVDELPRSGETLVSRGFHRHAGGKGANQAFAAARIVRRDVPVHLVACVGQDPDGRDLTAGLDEAGVDTTHLTVVDAPTGVALIAVDADGANTIVVVPGANHAWPPGLVSSIPLRPGDIVLCQLEIPIEVVRTIADHVRASGARLIINAAPFDRRVAEIAGLADVVVANEGEAAGLLGTDAFDAEDLVGAAVTGGDLIVTLGGRGSIVRTREGHLSAIDAIPVDVVDTVGAGDAFAGALAAVLAEGEPIAEAVEVAMAAGALTVSAAGSRDPSLSREAVDALRRRTE